MLLCTDAFLLKLGKRSFMFKGSPKSLQAALRLGWSSQSTTILGCGFRPLPSSTSTALGSVFLDLSLFHYITIRHDDSQVAFKNHLPSCQISLDMGDNWGHTKSVTLMSMQRIDGSRRLRGQRGSSQSAQSADDEASFRGPDGHGQHLGRRPAEARILWCRVSLNVSGCCLGSFSTLPRRAFGPLWPEDRAKGQPPSAVPLRSQPLPFGAAFSCTRRAADNGTLLLPLVSLSGL